MSYRSAIRLPNSCILQKLSANFCFKRCYTENLRVRVRKNPYSDKKIYLYNEYEKTISESKLILILQHSSLLSKELVLLRSQLSRHQAILKILNTGIFKSVIKKSSPEMEVLLKGPVCIIKFDDIVPSQIKAVLGIINRLDHGLILLGGAMTDSIPSQQRRTINHGEVEKFSKLKDLPELHSELLGLLTWVGCAQLKSILERLSQDSLNILRAHESNLDESEK